MLHARIMEFLDSVRLRKNAVPAAQGVTLPAPSGTTTEMKIVEAILTPYKLDAITELLIERGCQDIVVSLVKCSEIRDPRMSRYRDVEYVTDLPPKVKLEVVVGDAEAMPTVQAILHCSGSESGADESVSIGPLEQVVSIGISKPDSTPIAHRV